MVGAVGSYRNYSLHKQTIRGSNEAWMAVFKALLPLSWCTMLCKVAPHLLHYSTCAVKVAFVYMPVFGNLLVFRPSLSFLICLFLFLSLSHFISVCLSIHLPIYQPPIYLFMCPSLCVFCVETDFECTRSFQPTTKKIDGPENNLLFNSASYFLLRTQPTTARTGSQHVRRKWPFFQGFWGVRYVLLL